MVTDDRKRFGLHLDLPISTNLSLSSLHNVTRGGRLDSVAEEQINQKFHAALQIKSPGLWARAGSLSGGNQQKIVLGKALMTAPQIVFLDEPTRGIDVGAKFEIYGIIQQLATQVDAAGDEASADLMTQRLAAHEKFAWMLRSTLGGR